MLVIILQIVLLVFPIYTLIQLYRKDETLEEENETLKEEIKTLKEIHERMVRIYIIDRPKMYKKEIEDLREELKQLRQEKWINI